jgi:hypothetical protein
MSSFTCRKKKLASNDTFIVGDVNK